MTIDRRTFLLRTGLVATAPMISGLVSLPAMGQRLKAPPLDTVPPGSEAVPSPANDGIAFGIDGWRIGDDAQDADMVLFSINQSWRSAWR